MAIGTAGFTAMLAVLALEEQGITPGARRDRGYRRRRRRRQHRHPAAGQAPATGSWPRAAAQELAGYLKELGAAEVVDRRQFAEGSEGAARFGTLGRGRSTAVGGDTLVNLLKAMQYHGVVAACGLAGGASLQRHGVPVHPARRPADRHRIRSTSRPRAGLRYGPGWPPTSTRRLLERMVTRIALADVPKLAPDFLRGAVRGRLVVDTHG